MSLILKCFPKIHVFDELIPICSFGMSHLITEFKRRLRSTTRWREVTLRGQFM